MQTFDGTWKTIEKSEKGDTDFTQHGNSVSRNFGDILDSTTGSEDEMRPTFDAEDDFVKKRAGAEPRHQGHGRGRGCMESYTGSAKRRCPGIVNETWAETMTSKTDAHRMTDETHVSETMSSRRRSTAR